MKSIANQYKDLKEGKMSQANFMRNLRMSMPQVTNTMSFGDAVKVLKNKGIITESFDITEKENNEYPILEVAIEKPNEDAEFDAMLKQLEDEMAGEEAVKGQYDEELNEAKETTNPNKVHPQEYTIGIRYELKGAKGDIVKAERAVLKNLAKEPFYYTALKLSGKDIYKEAPSVKAEAPKKKSKKKEAELVDTINAMQKVKMPKTIKEAMEIDPQGQLQSQDSPSVKKLLDLISRNTSVDTEFDRLDTEMEIYQFLKRFFNDILNPNDATQDEKLRAVSRVVSDLRKQKSSSKVASKVFSSPQQTGLSKSFEKGELGEAEIPKEDEIEMELSAALDAYPTIKRQLKTVDLASEITGPVQALLDRTNLKNIPDPVVIASIKKILDRDPGPTFTSQLAANANIGGPNPKIGKTLKEKLTSIVREMLAEKEEAPSKKKAAKEITVKAVDYIDDYNEGEKTYKKSQLENVFDSYEDKVGRRFDDSVFEDVIDMLKAKGYTMTMKEMFDGRDNLTDISDDTK
jgi:hypothetical protein